MYIWNFGHMVRVCEWGLSPSGTESKWSPRSLAWLSHPTSFWGLFNYRLRTLTTYRFVFKWTKPEKDADFAKQLKPLNTSCSVAVLYSCTESKAPSQRTMALAWVQALVHQSILFQPYVTSGYHLWSSTKPHLYNSPICAKRDDWITLHWWLGQIVLIWKP